MVTDLAKPYEPTPCEQRALIANEIRREKRHPSPRFRRGGESCIEPDHPDRDTGFTLVMEELGTTDEDFAKTIIAMLSSIDAKNGVIDPDSLNLVLSLVKGICPKDEVETMLASQMAVVQGATIKAARRLEHAETVVEYETAERAFNKLARTFAVQVDTLKRYRSKATQRIYVEKVTVTNGGQALIGNIGKGEG